MKIGAHVSVIGGLYKAIENAQKIGAETIQIFGASPRQWVAKMPAKYEVRKYQEALSNAGIGPVFLHAPYLINLASSNKYIFNNSIKNLSAHLQIAELLGAEGLIFHVGSGKDKINKQQAVKQVSAAIKKILKNVPGKSCLILENTAGGGTKIGANINELASIIKQVKFKRLKVCFDTAHGLEAGMISAFKPQTIKKFFDEWDKKIGVKNLAVIHANDSKSPAGSHYDRHENIGKGCIGLAGFKSLVREKRIKTAPWILEVPGFQNEGPDKKNIDILKKICN